MNDDRSAGESPPSASALLDAVYRQLDFAEGTLLQAVTASGATGQEAAAWLEKGDWLSLAHEVGADKVFFVNDDPVVVFHRFDEEPSEHQQLEAFRRVWCMARPQCLFMAQPGLLRVYSLNRPPARTVAEWRELKPLDLVDRVADVAEQLAAYRREQVETGRLFADGRFGDIDQRADRRLIQDLKVVRKALLESGLEPRHAHALIGRSIFVRYLEDREVLIPAYFDQVAASNAKWQQILATEPEKPDLALDSEHRRYDRVLRDKEFTYTLFEQLAADFNGDMFPRDKQEEGAVTQPHCDVLRSFLMGDADPNQPSLFFWAYDFQIIPIGLISSIYEEFYHQANEDDRGTHYTPGVLVDYVLSQVLTEERLETCPRILDPACGSGAFLVEAFRRIVRHRVRRLARQLRPDELRDILRDQIVGIDVNEEAVHIAAFSLYLALLNYQEPPDILASKRLPRLIHVPGRATSEHDYHILHHANAFGLTASETAELSERLAHKRRFKGARLTRALLDAQQHLDVELRSFDVVVGNPPWFEAGGSVSLPCGDLPPITQAPRPFRYNSSSHTLTAEQPPSPFQLQDAQRSLPGSYHPLLDRLKALADEQHQALRWAEAFDKSAGDNNYSQLFIVRALSLAKPSGIIGLLVHSSVLFNQRTTSQAFRQQWLAASSIRTVTNFAQVRRLFFERGTAPFVAVSFEPNVLDSDRTRAASELFVYTSARRTQAVERARAVILTAADRRWVRQTDVEHRDYLWKTYWWGSHRDAALLASLDAEESLGSIVRRGLAGTGLRPGWGFERGHQPLRTQLRPLRSERLQWYGPLRAEWFEERPKGARRQPDEGLYRGRRLIVARGMKVPLGLVARLEYDDFSFHHTMYGVPLPFLAEWQAKVVLAIFWSALGRYRLFMTSGSWGTWYDQLVAEDILAMPIRLPVNQDATAERIVSAVDVIRTWKPTASDLTNLAIPPDQPPPRLIIDGLTDAVFDLFGLSELERDLVRDFDEFYLDMLNSGAKSEALQPATDTIEPRQGTIRDLPQDGTGSGFHGYIKAFLESWNRELEPTGELRWRVLRSPDATTLATLFTTQEKEASGSDPSSADERGWAEALERCSRALRQPVSHRVFIDGMVRAVTDTEIFIIKHNERRLWTRSAAREDAEATMVQAMQLQADAFVR